MVRYSFPGKVVLVTGSSRGMGAAILEAFAAAGATCLFLACEESGYITGQTLPITGGWF